MTYFIGLDLESDSDKTKIDISRYLSSLEELSNNKDYALAIEFSKINPIGDKLDIDQKMQTPQVALVEDELNIKSNTQPLQIMILDDMFKDSNQSFNQFSLEARMQDTSKNIWTLSSYIQSKPYYLDSRNNSIYGNRSNLRYSQKSSAWYDFPKQNIVPGYYKRR